MNRKLLALTTLGVVFVLLVLANVIVGAMGLNFRVDLTEDKIYTLSDGTRNVLARIPDDRQVQIRLHTTRDTRLMPEVLRQYSRNVEDLLVEYVNAGGGRVTLERIDPRPDTEDEDRAIEDEIRALRMQDGQNVYFGIAIQTLQQREVIPFLDPNDEPQLEYQITRAISNTISTGEPVLALASSMPVLGSMPMMPMMQQQGDQPWILAQQLERDYEVRDIGLDFDAIEDDVDLLLLIHPAGITAQAEYAIDQFVLRGGKALVFVDPESIVTTIYGGGQNPFGMQQPGVEPASTLPRLLSAWGIDFDPTQVVADMNFRTPFSRRQPTPTFLTLGGDAISRDNFATAPLDAVQLYEPGALRLLEREGVEHQVLLQSSPNSDLIDTATARQARDAPLTSFRPLNQRQVLGVQVTGRFRTAYPEGPPPPAPDPDDPHGDMPGFPGGMPMDFMQGAFGDDETAAPDDAEPTPANGAETADEPAAAEEATEEAAEEATEEAAEEAAEEGAGEASEGAAEEAAETEAGEAPAEEMTAEVAPVDEAPAEPAAVEPAEETDSAADMAEEAAADAPADEAAEPADGETDADAAPAPADAAPDLETPVDPVTALEAIAADLPEDHLTESVSDDGLVMVFADVDMLFDRFTVVQDPLTGGLRLGNGNLPMVLNAIELLLGGSDMIAIRSRSAANRPFTRMNELRDEVEAEFRPQIEELEQRLRDIETQMSDLRLQEDEEGNLVVLMTEEQRKSLQELEPTARDLDRQLRETRMELRRRIDRMEMRITLQNILAVPLVVIVFGIGLAITRRQRTRAR